MQTWLMTIIKLEEIAMIENNIILRQENITAQERVNRAIRVIISVIGLHG